MRYKLNSIESRKKAIEFLQALPLDGSLQVEFYPVDKDRGNTPQKRTFHMWRDVIAKEYGHDKEELKYRLKSSAWGTKFIQAKQMTDNGMENVTLVVPAKETATATKDDMMTLLLVTEQAAQFLNINLPQPEDYR